jgi:hypothetical protein
MTKSSSYATEQRENVKIKIIDSKKMAGRIRRRANFTVKWTGSPVSHSV